MGVASERLSLLIESRTTGAEDIAKLDGAIDKLLQKTEKAGKPPDSSSWEKFGSTLESSIANPLEAIGSAAKSALGALGPVGIGITVVAAAAAAGVTAFVSMAEAIGDAAEAQLNMSIRTGLTTTEVFNFTHAAQLAGVDAGAFEGAMKKLGQALGDSGEQGKKARETMSELHVALYDANGQLLPAGRLWLNLSGAISGIEDPFKRAAAAQNIFGKQGKELLPLLMELKGDVAELAKMGLGFDEKTLGKLDATADTLKKISFIWDDLIKHAKVDLILSLNPAVEKALELIRDARQGKGALGSASNTVRGIGAATGLIYDSERMAADQFGMWYDKVTGRKADSGGGLSVPAGTPSFALPKGELGLTSTQSATLRDIQGFLSAKQATIAALEEQSKKAKEALEAAENKFGGLPADTKPDVIKSQKNSINELSAAYQVLEDRTKAAKRAEEERQKFFELVQTKGRENFAEKLSATGGFSATVPQFQFPEQFSNGKKLYGPLTFDETVPSFKKFLTEAIKQPGNIPQLESLYGKDIDKEIADKRKEILSKYEAWDDELKKTLAEEDQQFRNESMVGATATLTALTSTFKGIRLAGFDRSATAAEQRAGYAGQLNTIVNAGPGQQQTQIRNELEIQLALTQKRASIETARLDYLRSFISPELQLSQKLLDDAIVRGQKEKDTLQARIEASLKIHELEKQQEQERRTFGENLTRSLFGGGAGVSSFFKSELESIASKVGGNAFANFTKSGMFQIGGQKDSDGKPNILGKLLAGTPLGIDPLKNSTDLNTVATDLNTQALIRALGSTAGGAGGVPGIGGLARFIGPGGTSGFAGPVGNSYSDFESDGAPDPFAGSTASAGAKGGPGKFGKTIGNAGAIVGGALGTYAGIKQGGARGGLTIASSLLGTAAVLDQEPISKGILAAAALATSLIQGFLPDPKKAREAFITRELQNLRFIAPEAQHLSIGYNGGYSDYDFLGRARQSNLSPYPTIRPGFTDRNGSNVTDIPAQTTSPGGDVHVHLYGDMHFQALDTEGMRNIAPKMGRYIADGINGGQQGQLIKRLQERL